MVDRLLAADVDGLWVLGVGAEQWWLNNVERDIVVQTLLGAAEGLPIAVGVTAVEPIESVRGAHHFRQMGCRTVFARQPANAAR